MKPESAVATLVAANAVPPRDALARLLDDLAGVILHVPDDVYTAKPLPRVSGSIGQHVRHALDHVAVLVTARPHGVMTYDSRERGTAIETDQGAALRAILRLKPLLEAMTDDVLDSPVVLTALLEREGTPESARSTLRRELAFVIDHTVHHQALIATLLDVTGIGAPEAFGLAPSTPRPAHS